MPYQTGQSLSLGWLLYCSDDVYVDIDDLNVTLVCIVENLNTKASQKETEYFVGCSSILHLATHYFSGYFDDANVVPVDVVVFDTAVDDDGDDDDAVVDDDAVAAALKIADDAGKQNGVGVFADCYCCHSLHPGLLRHR